MAKERSVGTALKRIFRQDDILSKIREQPAEFSLLMNRKRLEIFIHLTEHPCDHTRSIARHLDESLTTVNWHLGQLLGYSYLEARTFSRKKHYWPGGFLDLEDSEFIACSRNENAVEIIKALGNDTRRQKEIVSITGNKQQNIDFWLKRMTGCGLVSRKGKGIGTSFSISEDAGTLLRAYDSRAREYSAFLIELLRGDGLMPENPRFKGTRLGVDIRLPAGKRRIHLECSPLAKVRRYLL